MNAEMENPPATRDEQKAEFLRLLSQGRTVTQACRELKITWQTPAKWAQSDRTFAEKREDARAAGFDALAGELLTVPREFEPGRARVITENVRWLLSKWVPSTYGDKVSIDVTQTVDIGDAMERGRARRSRLERDLGTTVDGQVLDSIKDMGAQHTDSESDPMRDPAFLAMLE